MESKFTEEVTTYCRLNFSNEYIRKSKALFYPKFIPQKPIDFRKKCEKKSLRYFNADCVMNPNKNPQKQYLSPKKNSLRKDEKFRSSNTNLSNQKPKKMIEFKNENTKFLLNPVSETKQLGYRSLERQPTRKFQPKRNIIQELKNYQFKIKPTLKKADPLCIPPIPKFLVSRSSNNLNKSANLHQAKFNLQEQKRPPVSTPVLYEPNFSPDRFIKKSPAKYLQKVIISPVKNPLETNSLNLAFSSPIKMTRVPVLEKTPNIYTSQPQIPKKFASKINFPVQQNFTSNSEKFIKMFGEIEMEDGLKEDLIASIEFQPMRSQLENQPKVSAFVKQPESQKSTFINSEPKLRNIKSQSDFFEAINITKKSQFGQPSRTETKISPMEDFKTKNSYISAPFKKLQNVNFSNFRTNQIFESKLPEQNEKEEFRQKFEMRENFRSIISVHSECQTSSQSQDSIIIDNHPKQVISSRPIKTLF